MDGRSRVLLLAAALVTGGAVLDGAAVTLYWRPCAGQMLNGSAVNGYRFDQEFASACSVAMDQADQFPLPRPGEGMTLIGALGSWSAIRLAVAWLVMVLVLPMPWIKRLVAALPALLGLLVVAQSIAASSLEVPNIGVDVLGSALVRLVAITTPLAFACLVGNRLRPGLTASAVIVALAATAPGLMAEMWDYGVMIALSEANWDSPPGSGYVITVMLGLAAITTSVLALRGVGSPALRTASAETVLTTQ